MSNELLDVVLEADEATSLMRFVVDRLDKVLHV